MTLTQTAKAFRVFLASIFGAFIVILLVRVGLDVYRLVFPPPEDTGPPPTADVAFGKLPALEIEPLGINLRGAYTFQLDLVEAGLPTEPIVAPVAPIIRSPYGFLTSERAKELVQRFGLLGRQEQRLSATEAVWSAPSETLRLNEQTLNFSYRYDFRARPQVLVAGSFATQEQALEFAVNQMSGKQLLGGGSSFSGVRGQDLKNGHKSLRLLRYRNQSLEDSPSISQASLYRVDFYREAFSGYPILPPRFNQALVNLLLTGNQEQPMLELNYTYWVVNRQQVGTYPLKTSTQAFEELRQDAPAHLVFLGDLQQGALATVPTSPTVQVFRTRQAYLAYYEPEEAQNYLQPVWVFEGRARLVSGEELDFAAYVPAIDGNWVQR